MHKRGVCCRKMSVRWSVRLLHGNSRYEQIQLIPSVISSLFCYSGQSQIMQVISATQLLFSASC